MKPQIRLYKSGRRVANQRLNDVDARFFYKKLKQLIQRFEERYSNKLDVGSILICVDGKNIYRNREKLISLGIETVGNIIDYLGLEHIEIIISDNETITDKSITINNIYVLEIFTRGIS